MIIPSPQRSLSATIVDAEMPEDLRAPAFHAHAAYDDDRLGIITPDITRQLGQSVALGDVTILGIPLQSWLIIGIGAAIGGAGGAYIATRSGRGALGGTLGAAFGALIGVAMVQWIGPPEIETQEA